MAQHTLVIEYAGKYIFEAKMTKQQKIFNLNFFLMLHKMKSRNLYLPTYEKRVTGFEFDQR